MTIQVLLIPCDPAKPMEVQEIEADVQGMQALVGGYIEAVGLTEPLGTLYINEEGKLLHLPLNQRATQLMQRHNPMLGDVILGDAFVSGPPRREGQDSDADEYYLKMAD